LAAAANAVQTRTVSKTMCNPTQCRYLARNCHLVAAIASDGRISEVHPDSASALGYSAAKLADKPLSRLLPKDQHQHLARVLERSKTGQSVWDELALLAADRRRVPMLCCFQRLALPGTNGTLLLTGVRLDAFQAGGRTDAAALLGQLAFRCHGPAHRLMQAIEVILLQQPRSEAAERCRTELDALLDVMSRSISLPDAKRRRAAAGSRSPVDVVRVLDSAICLMDADPAYKGLRVELRPEEAAVWAAADPVGLVVLAMHLARNARDATLRSKSPRLLVNVHQAGGNVILEFMDNGSGLTREDLDCAFSPFFKNSPGSRETHTGLGLVTCSELVRYMGGRIRMESRPSRGTTVLVTLPAASPPK
jgi:signal transduction histidine kinase